MKPVVLGLFLLTSGYLAWFSAAQNPTTPAIQPGLDVRISYRYYPVTGKTVERIARSMYENGPRSEEDAFYAATSSQTGFSYRTLKGERYCRLDNVGVRTDVVMLLPQWVDRADAPEGLRRAWDKFLDRLLTHEGEHYRIVDKSTRQLFHALAGMRADDCAFLDSQAKITVEEMSAMQTALNVSFDERTDHGTGDGAVWPPPGYRENP